MYTPLPNEQTVQSSTEVVKAAAKPSRVLSWLVMGAAVILIAVGVYQYFYATHLFVSTSKGYAIRLPYRWRMVPLQKEAKAGGSVVNQVTAVDVYYNTALISDSVILQLVDQAVKENTTKALQRPGILQVDAVPLPAGFTLPTLSTAKGNVVSFSTESAKGNIVAAPTSLIVQAVVRNQKLVSMYVPFTSTLEKKTMQKAIATLK